jgi:flagellar basal body-associated protein FliL
MKFFSHPAFYIIVLLIAAMLLLTMWMSWKLDTLPKRKAKKENAPAVVSKPP